MAFRHAQALFERISEHEVLTLSAALAYYTALALSPLLIISFWTVGSLGFHDQRQLINQVIAVIGPEAGKVLEAIAENTRETPGLTSIAGLSGFLMLLLSAGTVFGQLQTSLNTIFGAGPRKSSGWISYLRRRIISMGMVFTLGFLAIVSLAANAAVSAMAEWWNTDLWLQPTETICSLVLFSIFFALLFRVLPDNHLARRDALLGGTLTAALFVIGKIGIGLYLGQTSVGSAYGAAGALIVLLLWLYYSSVMLLIGAEITAMVQTPRAPEKHRTSSLSSQSPDQRVNSALQQG